MLRVLLLGLVAALAIGALLLPLLLWAPDRPRAALERRYAAPPSQFLDATGIRVHLRDTGPRRDAPALVLIHGFGSSLHTWEDVAPALEERFRVVRLDLPGFGLSGPDPARDYADARTGAVVLALLDRLGVGRFHLAGSSMGGRVAFKLAAAAPERVERLVLLAPDGFRAPGRDYGEAPRAPWWVALVPHVLPEFVLRRLLLATYADPAALTPARFERYRDMLRAPGVRRAILDRAAANVLEPPEPVLARVRAPALLLWGTEDRLVPVATAELFRRALPDARVLVLPGVGHVPMEEAPEATARAMLDFLTP